MRTLISLAASLLAASSALASSHRESPNIANDPAADLTDVYSFMSPARPGNQVFIFNVSPGYLPAAGPNWYMFDPNVLYELHIDLDGSGVESLTYQFRFKAATDYQVATDTGILAFSGAPITFNATTNAYTGALSQQYTVTKVTGGARSGNATQLMAAGQGNFPVAPPRIGPFVTDGGNQNKGNATARYAAYQTLASHANVTADGGYMFFAGPRNDPFYVDLGGIFDGVNVRLLNDPAKGDGPRDSLAGTNVLSIVFEVPDTELNGKANFGVWATTSRPQADVKKINGEYPIPGGGWVQIQRLGNPLVNEVVIGMKDKDKWGYTQPKDDAANYAGDVVAPQLATILNALYGSAGITAKNLISNIPDTNRLDLVDVFVAGIPGVSAIPGATGAGDMLRVNRKLNLGAGYTEGWPLNGRKLEEPVVAIALSFLAGCKVLPFYGNFDISGITGGFGGNKWATTHTVANPGAGLKPTDTTTPANCLLSDGLVPASAKIADQKDDITPGGTGHLTDGNGVPMFPYEDLPFPAY